PGLFALLLLAAALAPAAAQEARSLRFEKTFSYKTGTLISLNAAVGPVRLAKVEFSQPSGSAAGSIVDRIRGGGSPETHSTIRAGFDAENPEEDEWVVTFTLDFLDSKGRLIDRATGKEGLEGEAKVINVDHSILTYVIPMIDRVAIKLEARLD
ncbi:MAG: hypothetical protein ABUL63_02240, partial [Acidobacteriota bacterium]